MKKYDEAEKMMTEAMVAKMYLVDETCAYCRYAGEYSCSIFVNRPDNRNNIAFPSSMHCSYWRAKDEQ